MKSKIGYSYISIIIKMSLRNKAHPSVKIKYVKLIGTDQHEHVKDIVVF